MRVLFLYPYLPSLSVPHGSARVVSQLLAGLRDVAKVTLVCGFRPHERHLVDSVRPLCDRLYAVERPFAEDLGWWRRNVERVRTGWRVVRTQHPVPVIKLGRPALRRALALALREERPDIVHVELSVMAQYITLLAGRPSVLVDHEAAGPPGEERSRWEAYVRRIYKDFDRVTTLCEEDARELARIDPELRISVRPPGVARPPDIPRRPEAHRVLFFGSGQHLPNQDALVWIAEEILPQISKHAPKAQVFAAGLSPDLPAAVLARAAGVRVLGHVDDLEAELARAAVVLSPVRTGRGVRIKNVETVLRGVPLVTTSLGARGLGPAASQVSIEEDASALARAVAAVLAQPEDAQARAHSARETALARFDPKAQVEITRGLWSEVLS